MDSIFDAEGFNARLFFPRQDRSPAPEGAQDLTVAVDGAALHLRWHRPPAGLPTVLLFHGNGEVVSDYDPQASSYAAVGAGLAVVDFRGYGQSTGTPTLRSALADAPRVADALVRAGAGALVGMGRSLGSACAAELIQAPPAAFRGFIWESGAADLAGLVRRRGLAVPDPLPEADLERFDPLRKLARGRLPMLFLHGEKDTLILPREADAAHAASGAAQKTLVRVPGRGHNDVSLSLRYWEAIRDFLRSLAAP
jgi:hypothetical protein